MFPVHTKQAAYWIILPRWQGGRNPTGNTSLQIRKVDELSPANIGQLPKVNS